MKRSVKICLSACLCLVLTVPQLFAADTEAVANRLVGKLPADNQRPDYYTGKHGFMNDDDINSEAGALEKGLYLMSWLATNPPIKLPAGTGWCSATSGCRPSRAVGSRRPRSRPAESPLSSTCGRRGGCISASSPTSRLPRFRWKRAWGREKGNRTIGPR